MSGADNNHKTFEENDPPIYLGNQRISNTGSREMQPNMNMNAAALFLAQAQQANQNNNTAAMFNSGQSQQQQSQNMFNAQLLQLLPQQQSFQQKLSNDSNNQQHQNNLNLSNELKFLQQIQRDAQNANALLMPPSTRSNDSHTAALLSVLDQKVRNPLFESPLAQTMMGLGGLNASLLQNNYLSDARLLMAQQSQLNPQLIMQSHLANAQGGGGGSILPQHLLQNTELPLPSPHALFHRDGSKRMRGGVIEPFPEKLHRLLTEVELSGRSDVISFVASGRAFAIHKPEKFFKEIVPLYFRQSRLSSFKRQLNLYGFELINTGPARGGYYHENFIKDQPDLCRKMRRVAVKVGNNNNKNGDDGELETELEQEVKEKESG